MKVKKQKRHRRSVRFYTTCFGFREPFKILCDGTFIHNLLANKIASPGDALSDILGAPTKLFTTRCNIAELKSLGNSYSNSLLAAEDLPVARCDHEKRKNAAHCIEDVIGENNPEHFFVATQDIDLRRRFREIPGVPVIFGLRNSLFLEPPSESQRQFVRSTEEERLHASGLEKMLLKKRSSVLTTQIATDSPDTHEDSRNQLVTEKVLTKCNTTRRMSNFVDRTQFKRKKAKGPNPLSCKKKKNQGNSSHAPHQDGKDGANAGRKRNRKRKRPSKGNKTGETDS